MSFAAIFALARRCWWIAPLALAGLFLVQRNDARQALRTEKAARIADRERADRQRADQERGFAQRQAGALSTFAAQLAAREPIIVHSTNTVREYAQTDAGRARCLGADRVRGLDAYFSALAGADPAPAGGRAEAVRTDANPAPARR